MAWDDRTAREMVADHRRRMAEAQTLEAKAEEVHRFDEAGRTFGILCGVDPMRVWEDFAEIDADQERREGWRQTWKEYHRANPKALRLTHKTIVENAVAIGLPVPLRVVLDYRCKEVAP